MDLKTLKIKAAEILKTSKHKLIIDLDKLNELKKEVSDAITKEDVRKLIEKDIVKKKQNTGQSKGRAKILYHKKQLKRKRGPGTRKGTIKARKKRNEYNVKVRALRKDLKNLKINNKLNDKNYRSVYLMIKGNYFRGKKHLKEYVGENK